MKRYSLVATGRRIYLRNDSVKYWGGPGYIMCVRMCRHSGDVLNWSLPVKVDEGISKKVFVRDVEVDIIYLAQLLANHPEINVKSMVSVSEENCSAKVVRVIGGQVGVIFPTREYVYCFSGMIYRINCANQIDTMASRYKTHAHQVEALVRSLELVGIEAK